MTQFIQQVINGLSVGSIYAIVALGYTMVYGIIKLINFAHGEVYMVGAYIGYICIAMLGLNVYVSLLIAMAGCALLGVIIEKVAYKPLRKSAKIATLTTAIGVSFLLQYVMMYIFGADIRTFPTQPNPIYTIGGIQINFQQIQIFVITILLMVGLHFIVKKTKIGKAMRAVSVDAETAQLMGISTDNTISFTFAIGSALAGAAGVIIGIYYTSINPLMGSAYGIKTFVAAVLGGIGIIPGAMLGGFVIGLSEIFVSGYISSTLKDGVVYAILIAILLFKPTGILGKNTKDKV